MEFEILTIFVNILAVFAIKVAITAKRLDILVYSEECKNMGETNVYIPKTDFRIYRGAKCNSQGKLVKSWGVTI